MSSKEQTFYEILRVSTDATLRDIRIAYRKIAMVYHPDVNPEMNNVTCHHLMCKINEAYQVLRDENLRKEYDMYLENNMQDAKSEEPKYEKNNSITKSGYRRTYQHTTEEYNYLNCVDFFGDAKEDFIMWLEEFAKIYYFAALKYYENNSDLDASILEDIVNSFNLNIEVENKKTIKRKR